MIGHAFEPNDLTIVIPTRDRWHILRRTLDALGDQRPSGFEIVVVVDGDDQVVPDDLPARVVVQRAAGAAVARNRGIAEVDTRLAMLLDDDMIPVPGFVDHHLQHHRTRPETEVAVLGRAVWHDEVPSTRITRWLDRSNIIFEFERLADHAGEDVGWGRFVSCNVSFKTELFRRVGGFDERFIHHYEDTDLALRLGEAGMVLLHEPAALTRHLQSFEWEDVVRRFDKTALGERLMVDKHDDFPAWFAPQMRRALAAPARPAWWTHVVDRVPRWATRLRRAAVKRSHEHFFQQLAPRYLAVYERGRALSDLWSHLGVDYEPLRYLHDSSATSLYRLVRDEVSGIVADDVSRLAASLPAGAAVLDAENGIGSAGIELARRGHRAAVAVRDDERGGFVRHRTAQGAPIDLVAWGAPIVDVEAVVVGGADGRELRPPSAAW